VIINKEPYHYFTAAGGLQQGNFLLFIKKNKTGAMNLQNIVAEIIFLASNE
jgi:hypothetical protein